MSSDQPRRRESSGSPGSPMGSTAAIVIAIVAVVAGFLILRNIGDDDDNGSTLTDNTTGSLVSTPDVVATNPPVITDPATTSTTIFTPTFEGATIVVANASTVNGAAGILTTALVGKGFTAAKATNSAGKQDVSTVLYNATDPDALLVAQSVATLMGGIEVSELGTPPPTKDGTLADGVTVVVMLGNDKANTVLDAMSTTSTTTTVAGATGDTVAGTPTVTT
jgi:hypothetical protein